MRRILRFAAAIATACSLADYTVVQGSFTLSVEPTYVAMNVADAGPTATVNVVVVRDPGFDEPITVDLRDTYGIVATTTIPSGQTTGTLVLTAPDAGSQYFVAEVHGAAVDREASAPLEVRFGNVIVATVASQVITLPPDVDRYDHVSVAAWGGGGGGGCGAAGDGVSIAKGGGDGGAGGFAEGDFHFAPGQTLVLTVGNGGGQGIGTDKFFGGGGGGGGYTEVTLADGGQLVLAGGGGGGAGGDWGMSIGTTQGGAGGAGSGLDGLPGETVGDASAGLGGTQSAGGASGYDCAPKKLQPGSSLMGASCGSTAGLGGAGGAPGGGQGCGTTGPQGYTGGGGGGAGYFGGGVGTSGCNGPAGGGGGGSGFVASDAGVIQEAGPHPLGPYVFGAGGAGGLGGACMAGRDGFVFVFLPKAP